MRRRSGNRSIRVVILTKTRRLEQEEQERPDPRALAKLTESVRLIRESARRAGLDKLTMREIEAEVAAARKGMRAKAGHAKKSTKRFGK